MEHPRLATPHRPVLGALKGRGVAEALARRPWRHALVECLSLSIRGHTRCTFLQFPRRCTFLQFPVSSAILCDTYLDQRGEVGQPGNRPLPLRMVSVGNSRAWKLTTHTPLRTTRGAQSTQNTEPGCTHGHTRRGWLNAPGREVPSLRRKDVYPS